ncbi:MAG TPA: outer membrane lipoprotein carrier protein LolA [Chthoniobacterales bacterium]|jgi:outer membrane lipoprotein carrier protein|nr:outer membrane lipoprotein carrier protein LolA [Chthoniobacterales bacterium]
MIRLIIVLLFALASLTQAAPLSQSETQDLVRRIQAASESRPSFEANFLEERETGVLKQPLKNEGKIWATLPDKIRREINGATPSATVIDGNNMVVYYPNLKEEEVYDLEKRPMLKDSLQAITAGLDFQQLNNYYYVQASRQGAEYQITLTPKTSAVSKIVKWVVVTVNQNLLPSHVELETARGQKVDIRYSDVRHRSIPNSMFQLTPPPDTKVTHPLGPGGRAF